ncbi:MAG: hypothetical protein HQL09_08485 [Nitrospirae bacterium]|nr:hypothetical protein [Nitrospirota bacterium]
MEAKRSDMKEKFLGISPLSRLRKMNAIFNDMVQLKSKTSGIPEYEVYRRYLKSDK